VSSAIPLSISAIRRAEFINELERQRIAVGSNVVERFFGDLIYGVGRALAANDIMSAAHAR
jgi:hypothetical protein